MRDDPFIYIVLLTIFVVLAIGYGHLYDEIGRLDTRVQAMEKHTCAPKQISLELRKGEEDEKPREEPVH